MRAIAFILLVNSLYLANLAVTPTARADLPVILEHEYFEIYSVLKEMLSKAPPDQNVYVIANDASIIGAALDALDPESVWQLPGTGISQLKTEIEAGRLSEETVLEHLRNYLPTHDQIKNKNIVLVGYFESFPDELIYLRDLIQKALNSRNQTNALQIQGLYSELSRPTGKKYDFTGYIDERRTKEKGQYGDQYGKWITEKFADYGPVLGEEAPQLSIGHYSGSSVKLNPQNLENIVGFSSLKIPDELYYRLHMKHFGRLSAFRQCDLSTKNWTVEARTSYSLAVKSFYAHFIEHYGTLLREVILPTVRRKPLWTVVPYSEFTLRACASLAEPVTAYHPFIPRDP